MVQHARVKRALVVLALSAISLRLHAQETKRVEVFGRTIVYNESGSGAPVILLHGLGADKNIWRFTTPALAAKFHVYALDQIGFGESDKPLVNYRPAMLSDFLDEFMRKLSIEKASIVGNSLGGWVAADFAIRYPARVEKLVLVDASGYVTRNVTREDMRFLNPSTLDETRAMVKRVFFNEMMHNEIVARAVYEARMRAGDGYTIDRFIDSVLRREDFLNDRLGSIKAPTLVVFGARDPLIPAADEDAMAQHIAGAKKVAIEQCGHIPELECAPAFHEAVLAFLQ